jgi:hypothetical protein
MNRNSIKNTSESIPSTSLQSMTIPNSSYRNQEQQQCFSDIRVARLNNTHPTGTFSFVSFTLTVNIFLPHQI